MEESEGGEEQDRGVKKKVVELSVQSGVSSAFTAFVAVNKHDGEAIQGPLVHRDVPAPSEYFIQFRCEKPVQFSHRAHGAYLRL